MVKKHILVFFLFFSTLTLFSSPNLTLAKPEEEPIPILTVNSKDILLKEFIDQVSLKSGYTIVVSNDLLQIPVTGSFTDVNLEQLFHKIFRNHNVFQIIDTGKKELLIYTDLKGKQNAYSSQPQQAAHNPNLQIDLSHVEVRPGVTLGELRKERETLAQKMNSGEITVEGDGGPTYLESKENREQLAEKLESDEKAVDLEQGRTLHDLKKSREQLEKNLDPSKIPLDTGSNITFQQMLDKRAELERQIASGEIKITEDKDQ